MKKEIILELFEKFEGACYSYKDVEYWSARDLQHILGYLRWENFFNVVNKAKKSCEAAGSNIEDHFRDATKMITIAKGGQREVDDIALTRYASYLIAQNGDPAKQAIAFAQTYFAVQTRKQEIIEQRLIDVERVTAREKLTKSEKKLSGILYERGVDSAGFAVIRSKGDQALFGGFSTNDMKKKLGVPTTKPLADFLPTLTIKAKDFANELTSHNVIEKDLNNNAQISKEHVDNNKAVRDILLQRGVKPESLPAAEDVKKLERRLESDEKKVSKTSGKPKK
ncbi:DNA damage-inducible protein D [Mucilaginibacter flavus]|uniref:DNA damage-inducible protein D n=1 Tax=Mucilaginibacter flavus TaxID=931504 RepID=UPI0025B2E7DB|nr:DNA damage-inducible protein D [Mucilaginibacter flavus]MDN3581924.1 DNA damage-inducible protein D [Mucilaginibacter flavus]